VMPLPPPLPLPLPSMSAPSPLPPALCEACFLTGCTWHDATTGAPVGEVRQ
jgi:hypothetical protein